MMAERSVRIVTTIPGRARCEFAGAGHRPASLSHMYPTRHGPTPPTTTKNLPRLKQRKRISIAKSQARVMIDIERRWAEPATGLIPVFADPARLDPFCQPGRSERANADARSLAAHQGRAAAVQNPTADVTVGLRGDCHHPATDGS